MSETQPTCNGSARRDLRVTMLDPSNFTVPYDNYLCRALAQELMELTLLGRPARPSETKPAEDIRFVEFFHRYSEKLRTVAPRVSRVLKAIEHTWNCFMLRRRIYRDPPDVLHVQWMLIPSIETALLSGARLNVPTVLTVHDSRPFHGTHVSKVQTKGWLNAIRSFDQLIVHTGYSKQQLVNLGVDESRINVVAHGPLPIAGSETDKGVIARPDQHAPLRFLLFGHLKPYKGIAELVEAIRGLPESTRRRIRITLAGKPDASLGDLTKLIDDAGLRSTFELKLRFLSDNELADLINSADVLLFPYHVIDASGAFMAVLPLAKVIIASDIGVFSETLTHNEDGLLVTPGDVPSLAKAVQHLAEDSDSLARLSDGATSLASRIPDWSSIALDTTRVYDRALRARCQ